MAAAVVPFKRPRVRDAQPALVIGLEKIVNHNTLVYQYRLCYTMPLYCTSALSRSVIQCRPITRAGSRIPTGRSRRSSAGSSPPPAPRGQPEIISFSHKATFSKNPRFLSQIIIPITRNGIYSGPTLPAPRCAGSPSSACTSPVPPSHRGDTQGGFPTSLRVFN